MKRSLLFLILFAAACTNPTPHLNNLSQPQYVYLTVAANTNQYIMYDEASNLVFNFLNQRDLGPNGTRLAIGGLIDSAVLSHFKEPVASAPGKYTVIDFYLCHHTADPRIQNDNENFYLALKQEINFDPGTSIPTPLSDQEILYISNIKINYINNITLADVKSFIERQFPIADNGLTTDGRTVKAEAQEFQRLYAVGGVTANYDPALVVTKDNILSILNQTDPSTNRPVQRMRYYLGYSAVNTRDKIRLVFMGVRKDGISITTNKPVMMEHEWPPDVN